MTVLPVFDATACPAELRRKIEHQDALARNWAETQQRALHLLAAGTSPQGVVTYVNAMLEAENRTQKVPA